MPRRLLQRRSRGAIRLAGTSVFHVGRGDGSEKEAVTSLAASESRGLFAFERLCDESLLFAATYSTSGILYDCFEFVQLAAMLPSIISSRTMPRSRCFHRPTSHGSPGRYGELSVFATRMERCASRLTGYLCKSLVPVRDNTLGVLLATQPSHQRVRADIITAAL